MAKIRVIHDPRLLEPGEYPPPPLKRALGLDLATSTGYAVAHFDPGRSFRYEGGWLLGQASLESAPYESGAMRFVKLRQLLETADPDFVALEEIRNTPGSDFLKGNRATIAAIAARVMNTAQLLGAFMWTVSTWCEQHGVPCAAVPIGTIKKRATGRGNAGKPEVIAACNELFGVDLPVENHESTGADNVADAAFCLLVALEQYGRGVDPIPRPPGPREAAERETDRCPDS